MKIKILLIIAVLGVLGALVIAALTYYAFSLPLSDVEVVPVYREIAVAATDLEAGTELTKENVDFEVVDHFDRPSRPIRERDFHLHEGRILAVELRQGDGVAENQTLTSEEYEKRERARKDIEEAAQKKPDGAPEIPIKEAMTAYLELLRAGSIDELVEQTDSGHFRAQIISECGEPPFPEPEKVVIENDEEMLRTWFEEAAGSWTDCDQEGVDGPGSRPEGCRWDNPLTMVSPELAPIECDEGCCEMGMPGLHNTPFLTYICFEERVVTEINIHDGC